MQSQDAKKMPLRTSTPVPGSEGPSCCVKYQINVVEGETFVINTQKLSMHSHHYSTFLPTEGES